MTPLRPSVATEGMSDIIAALVENVEKLPERNVSAPFYFAVDHCFAIKGHGTVLTGTVMNGSVSVHSTIEIPHLQEQKKVKQILQTLLL